MTASRLRRFALCAPSLLLLGAAAPKPAPAVENVLQPHRAIYEIGLAHATKGSGVTSAEGQMVFELTGSACAGYTMRQRLMVNLGDEEGNDGLLDFRISTFESGTGDLFRFVSRTTVNSEVVEDLQGVARRTGSGIEVKLDEPQPATVELDGGTLFPSQHLQTILAAAQADKRFVASEIYEGSGTGDGADSATAAIGKPRIEAGGAPVTGGVRSWPVSVGYFSKSEPADDAQESGEQTPTYQMSFTLLENGVTKDLVMNYGKYALTGKLERIDPITPAACD